MDKETELAYLKSIVASSHDMVNVLETIATQFKSMEKATNGIITNWSTVFNLSSKPSSDEIRIITVPTKNEEKK